jgi:hypothetical protein
MRRAPPRALVVVLGYARVMARFTATEMVGVPLTSAEVRRLLTALDEARLPPASTDDDTVLRQKLTVMLQVAEAGERRRATGAATTTTARKPGR